MLRRSSYNIPSIRPPFICIFNKKIAPATSKNFPGISPLKRLIECCILRFYYCARIVPISILIPVHVAKFTSLANLLASMPEIDCIVCPLYFCINHFKFFMGLNSRLCNFCFIISSFILLPIIKMYIIRLI